MELPIHGEFLPLAIVHQSAENPDAFAGVFGDFQIQKMSLAADCWLMPMTDGIFGDLYLKRLTFSADCWLVPLTDSNSNEIHRL